jgi:four helix bundle protein
MKEAPYLDHENLDVYRCAIDFLVMTTRFGAALPGGESELRDQLKPACISIPLNIAESCGKTSAPEGARCLSIARGSALEMRRHPRRRRRDGRARPDPGRRRPRRFWLASSLRTKMAH